MVCRSPNQRSRPVLTSQSHPTHFPASTAMTKPVVRQFQFTFRHSASRPLPHQSKNEQRLEQQQNNATDDVPPIQLPDRRLPVQHHTAGREVAFLQSPALKGSPIDSIDVGAPNDGNILRLLTVKHPDGHLANRLPDSRKAHQITTDGSVSEVHIVHDKDRRTCGAGNHGNGLACVDEARLRRHPA